MGVTTSVTKQSSRRCQHYAADPEGIVHAEGLSRALIGETAIATKYGSCVKVRYVRGLIRLESNERDRLANFAIEAVAAGLAERRVRVAERQGQLMVEMVQVGLREVDLSAEQASAFKAAFRYGRHER